MSENIRYNSEYDRENNFEVVWRGGTQNVTEYTVVKVPISIPAGLEFRKVDSKTNFDITPSIVAPGLWDIKGIISPDICKGLGMPVVRFGERNEQCLLEEKEIEYLQRFGKVIGNWENDSLNIDLTYESQNIKRLLSYLWRPLEVREDKTKHLYSLDSNQEFQFLPQKRGRVGRKSPKSTLKVVRL